MSTRLPLATATADQPPAADLSAGWALAATLAAIVLWPFYRGGIPGFSHDWVWSPVAAQTVSQWALLFSGWYDTALGSPNAVPTLNPLAWLKVLPALFLPDGSSQTAYLTASLFFAFAGVYAIARKRLELRALHAAAATVLFAGTGFILAKVASGQSSYWPSSAAFIWGCYFLLGSQGARNTARAAIFFAFSTLMLQFTAFAALTCAIYALAFRTAPALRRAALAAIGAMCFAIPALVLLAGNGPARGADIPPPTLYWERSMSPHIADAISYFTYAGHYPERALLSLGTLGPIALDLQRYAAQIVALLAALAVAVLFVQWIRKSARPAALFFALMAIAGFIWMTGISGPASALWLYAFRHAEFAAFFREFFHSAILFALPASILPVLLIAKLRGNWAAAYAWALAVLAAFSGIATWTGGPARLLPFVQAPPYERAATQLFAHRQGTILYLPALQPLAVRDDVLGGNDIFDWAGPDVISLFRYHVQPPVAYALDRLHAGDAAGAKDILERMACIAVVVRPDVTSLAPDSRRDRTASLSTLRRAFGAPAELPGGALLFQIGAKAPASSAGNVRAFDGTFAGMRDPAATYIDRPGTAPEIARLRESPDPRLGWTNYVNAPWLASPALASPQYGIVTMQKGARARAHVQSGSALVWAPKGVRIDSRLVIAPHLEHVAFPARSVQIVSDGPAAIGEAGAAPVLWRNVRSAQASIVRVNAWTYRGTARLHGRGVIVLRRSWDPNWRLAGQGIRVLDHARADGFGNAWLVEGNGSASFSMVYGVQRKVEWLLAASACMALLIVLYGTFGPPAKESATPNP